jgi:23S rRNA (adenine2503-C2)-methyltransferase
MTDVLSLDPGELGALVAELGAPAFRGRQLFQALWRDRLEDWEALRVWPQALRVEAARRWPLRRLRVVRTQTARDGTAKLLVRLADGEQVETVVLPHPYGWSVCVSTEVGCAMGCRFCASGLRGKVRRLTAGEMLDQVSLADAEARRAGARITRIDLMGVGEPLDNYDATVRFLRLAHDPLGFGIAYRRMTVSTSGLVPRILRLADEGLPVTLAVSLHAPDDALRSRLMPVNRAYPVQAVLDAARTYFARTGRRVTFEYLLIAGVNDGDETARRLAARLRGLAAHVNLIPWNPVPEFPYQPSPPERVRAFRAVLEAARIPCTVRKELGQEIAAACGQLRSAAEGQGT